MLEERIATLEGGVAALATSSGMAAFDLATFILADVGDNIVSSSSLYGGTYTYLTHTVEKRGVETKFVDTLEYDAYEAAIDDDTAFVHLETIGNPALVTPDLERIADIAHDHNVPLFVDNTFATPYLCRPLEHGADLVWHSTTKWLHGAGSTVGGVLVDGGSFNWDEGDYPEITDRIRRTTGSTSTKRSATWHSPSSPARVACAIWATSSRPSTPGSHSRNSSRCHSGWTNTARTRWSLPSISRITTRCHGSPILVSRVTRRTTKPASTSTAGMAA